MIAYQYKVSDFEGPLDLLLYLIEKNKVDIYNIPIAQIADQFNAYVEKIQQFDVDYASKFFVMAATLLQIKSRLLLPKQPKLTAEEEEDPQEALVRQLVEYKQMKAVSQAMKKLFEVRSQMLERPASPLPQESRFQGTIEVKSLYQAFQKVYQALGQKAPVEVHISREVYRVDECMRRVLYSLRRSRGALYVAAVFRACRSRVELVVTFLAVLELLKQGRCETALAGEDGNTLALRYKPGTESRSDSAPGSPALSQRPADEQKDDL